MNKIKTCRKCGVEKYQDERGVWFCPDCIVAELNPAFLDEQRDHPGELTQPYLLSPPTKQVSIRLAISDVQLARTLAQRKGIPKYQTYIKTLLHEALAKEAGEI